MNTKLCWKDSTNMPNSTVQSSAQHTCPSNKTYIRCSSKKNLNDKEGESDIPSSKCKNEVFDEDIAITIRFLHIIHLVELNILSQGNAAKIWDENSPQLCHLSGFGIFQMQN